MTRKNQSKLDKAATRRQLKAEKDNIELSLTTDNTSTTRALTPEEVEAELALEAEGAAADNAKEKAIAHAQQVLRDYGLYYTITSDRTADRASCLCGCGQFPAGKKSKFCPGHDAKFHSALSGPKEQKFCACGCGTEVKGTWAPGHNAQHAKKLKQAQQAA